MLDDPIVEKVREIRRQIEEECQNDIKNYYKYLTTVQKKYSDRLVRRSPKPIQISKRQMINS